MSTITKQQARQALWHKGNLSWKLWPQQKSIYDTVRFLPRTVQTVVLLCARQYGKSVLGTILASEDCLQNPDVVVMIIGPTIKQTRAIVFPRMRLITKDAPKGLIRFVKSEDCWYFNNGSELRLGGFDTSSSAERGKTIHKVYLEETCDSDSDDYDNFLRSDLGPALTHSKHAQIIHLTTLPRVPDHKFVTDTIPEARLNGAYFEYTIDDNKQLTPEKYAQCVKLAGGTHTIEFQREYLCKQVRDSGLILAPEFDEGKHVRPIARPEYCTKWLGGDIGGVRDKSVVLLCAYDFDNAKTLILDECSFPAHTSITEMLTQIKTMESDHKIVARYIDMPGQTRVDLMALGFPTVLPTKPTKDALEISVNQVRVALSQDKVLIDAKCKLLVQTLRSGTFNNTRTDLARTSTLGHMDSFMALAYGLRMTNRSNPYPLYGGVNMYDTRYYIPDGYAHESRTAAKTLAKAWNTR